MGRFTNRRLLRTCLNPCPFGDGAVDLVVAHHLLEHMDGYREGPAFMIEEVYGVLKSGAAFIVTVPDLQALAKGGCLVNCQLICI